MIALVLRCLALALLFVVVILELVGGGSAVIVSVLRDAGFAAFIASFLP